MSRGQLWEPRRWRRPALWRGRLRECMPHGDELSGDPLTNKSLSEQWGESTKSEASGVPTSELLDELPGELPSGPPSVRSRERPRESPSGPPGEPPANEVSGISTRWSNTELPASDALGASRRISHGEWPPSELPSGQSASEAPCVSLHELSALPDERPSALLDESPCKSLSKLLASGVSSAVTHGLSHELWSGLLAKLASEASGVPTCASLSKLLKSKAAGARTSAGA